MTGVNPSWIAVDWGTTNVRAWAMGPEDTVLAEVRSDQGMGRLKPTEFEGALQVLVSDWSVAKGTPVVACGMVGSRQGWFEAPYAFVPCKPSTAVTKAPSGPAFSVRIIGGVAQKSPPDVMRGEETQIAGFLRLNPDFDGVVCLPGTHTKWVHISAGEIVSFQTFMTGEIFGLLSDQSVLRHSMGEDFCEDTFQDAVTDSLGRPQGLAANLFAIRAAGLVGESTPAIARGRLSGLLIGLELAGSRPYWLGQNVAIIAASSLAKLYGAALTRQGVPVIETDANRMTLEGLKAAFAHEKEIA